MIVHCQRTVQWFVASLCFGFKARRDTKPRPTPPSYQPNRVCGTSCRQVLFEAVPQRPHPATLAELLRGDTIAEVHRPPVYQRYPDSKVSEDDAGRARWPSATPPVSNRHRHEIIGRSGLLPGRACVPRKWTAMTALFPAF